MGKNVNMLDIVLARAEQSSRDKIKIINLKSEALGDIIVKVPPFRKVADWIDEVADKGDELSTWEATLSNAQMVFESVPFLKDNFEQLSEAYEEKDPAMLTVKIFEAAEALGEIGDIAQQITTALGADKTTIKNS